MLALERSGHALRYTARVRECCTDVADVRPEAEAIEGETPEQSFERQWYALNPLLFDILLHMPVENIASIGNVLPVSYQHESLDKIECQSGEQRAATYEDGKGNASNIIRSAHFFFACVVVSTV